MTFGSTLNITNSSSACVFRHRCEHDFWGGRAVVDEPIAATSGLVIFAMGLFGDGGVEGDLQFFLAKSSLAVCGLATVVYHSIDTGDMGGLAVNGILLDGFTMALVTANTGLIYTPPRFYRVSTLAWMVYLLFWVTTNDYMTFMRLDAVTGHLFAPAVLYPLFGAPFAVMFVLIACRYGAKLCVLYIALGVAVASWLLQFFGCCLSTCFFIFHTVWHIAVAYVAYSFMVVGHAYSNERDVVYRSALLPTVLISAAFVQDAPVGILLPRISPRNPRMVYKQPGEI